jgi:hypothetical protein
MNQTISSTGLIKLPNNKFPRLEFEGRFYLDFYTILRLIGEKMPRTTLFCLLKKLPFANENLITYRNKNYYCQTFIQIHLRKYLVD